jgi:hypothetical protein
MTTAWGDRFAHVSTFGHDYTLVVVTNGYSRKFDSINVGVMDSHGSMEEQSVCRGVDNRDISRLVQGVVGTEGTKRQVGLHFGLVICAGLLCTLVSAGQSVKQCATGEADRNFILY